MAIILLNICTDCNYMIVDTETCGRKHFWKEIYNYYCNYMHPVYLIYPVWR